jgi:hypothetical protein
MAVTMICPNLECRQTVIAPDSARGKVVRCAHCHQTFIVPAKTSPPVTADDEEAERKSRPAKR